MEPTPGNIRMKERDLVIIGAGPAGMAAAISAAENGLTCTVIDENHRVGGQIYRQPPPAFRTNGTYASTSNSQRGSKLREQFEKTFDKIELLTDTTVWGVFPPRQVAIRNNEGCETISASHLVFATGAYEYVCPFPGWTLPGVMTPGAAQSMVKTMQVQPGKRALVAGSGPFLLVVAEQLHLAGVEVVGVVEATRRRDALPHAASLMASPGLLREGGNYLKRLQRAGIPIYWGHLVVEANGTNQVDSVVLSKCDSRWSPSGAHSKTLKVDTLCVGFGFVPRVELAQLAGCRMQHKGALGGWIPEVDVHGRTSVPGVWVVGDGGGVSGAVVAELEGSQAGHTIAHAMGSVNTASYEASCKPLRQELARLRRFRAALDRIYQIRDGLCDLPTHDTIVCRCEEITRGEFETGIQYGGTDIRTLKVMTRLGMGPCQGRMCWPAAARFIAHRTAKSLHAIGPRSVRPPTEPICVADFSNQIMSQPKRHQVPASGNPGSD